MPVGKWLMDHGWFHSCRGSNTNVKKFNIRFFRYDALRIATNNFSTLLGRGGYGSLFKGVLSDDARVVSILRLHKPYRDGFLEMVELMSHLRHINLIQVLGCCVEKAEQLLVCEYADNGSVSHHLQTRKRRSFNWERRAAVCIGTARGLSYLHEDIDPQIIHRDIKPSNILLDSNFVPKIVDFDLIEFVHGSLYVEGASRGSPRFEYPFSDSSDSSVCTTVKGTLGYLDPNYKLTGQLADKVDVYSFGVTMLEIISGRNSVDNAATKESQDRWILDWVKRMRIDGMVLKIVDPMLTDFAEEDVERFINVALLCVHPISEERPGMFEVVYMLYGRHKSDQELAEMATRAAAAQPAQWSVNIPPAPGSMSSLTISTLEVNESSASTRIDHEEPGETASTSHTSIVPVRKGKCSSKVAALQPAKIGSASSSKEEEQRCKEDLVGAYFERSMEKIMRFQAAAHSASNRATTTTNTMVIKRSSQRISMEAVYPPLLSGEYSRKPSQI